MIGSSKKLSHLLGKSFQSMNQSSHHKSNKKIAAKKESDDEYNIDEEENSQLSNYMDKLGKSQIAPKLFINRREQ